jgi:proline iminopeptidase
MILYSLFLAAVMTVIQPTNITIPESVYELKVSNEETLFPAIKPSHEGYLKVSDLHQIWYAEYGNPKGMPVVVVHGGPGAGSGDNDMRFFDPEHYRIILFDQRGAYRSKPFAEIKDNTPQTSIEDMEKLRKYLNIEKWLVFGGSWGSTLSLAYGEAYPDRVHGFILRGIFLGRDTERDNVWYGMQDTFPEVWEEYVQFLPEKERKDLMTSYYKRLINPDPKIHMPAARSFLKYDFTAAFLTHNSKRIDEILKDDKLILGCARMFAHYSVNNFFFKENQILDNLSKIKHLPAIIVHGRYDTICRAKSAYELHKNWPGSELKFIQDASHSASEPGITKALVEATEKMKGMIK